MQKSPTFVGVYDIVTPAGRLAGRLYEYPDNRWGLRRYKRGSRALDKREDFESASLDDVRNRAIAFCYWPEDGGALGVVDSIVASEAQEPAQ